MSLILCLLAGWFGAIWFSNWREQQNSPKEAPPITHLHYAFDVPSNLALALAHPMGLAHMPQAYATPTAGIQKEELARTLGPALLHMLGLRNDLDGGHIRNAVTQQLRQHWYRMDLHALRPQDNPRDALAFACARVAFVVRVAAALGWVDDDTQWKILLHNAQRAHDCFQSWQDYGHAWARGRKQWIANSRADSLGIPFDEARVEQWLKDPKHPWRFLPWHSA
jgi:hypothetical protein